MNRSRLGRRPGQIELRQSSSGPPASLLPLPFALALAGQLQLALAAAGLLHPTPGADVGDGGPRRDLAGRGSRGWGRGRGTPPRRRRTPSPAAAGLAATTAGRIVLVVEAAPEGFTGASFIEAVPPGPLDLVLVEQLTRPTHLGHACRGSMVRPVFSLFGVGSVMVMRYVEAAGVRLSAIGLGTWQFGSREWGYGRDYAEREAVAICHRALDLGVNLIDTAEIYGMGKSERIVGRAVADQRDRAFLASKIAPFVPFDPVVRSRAKGSLRRLGVDRLDLYQAHWPNPAFPVGPLMRAFAALQGDGLITHVGVSNYSLAGWQAAESALAGPVLSNQVEYSLAVRTPEADLLGWAQGHDRIVIAYSPLAQGFLSDRYSADHRPRGVRAANPLFLPENLARSAELRATLREIAVSHGVTPSQVALAWVIRRPQVVAIPGASSVAQLEANVAAAELELSDAEDRQLTEASDRFTPRTGRSTIPDVVKSVVAARLRR